MIKFFNCLIIFILFLIFLPNLVLAQEYFFQDEFNLERPINTLDPDKWTVYPNGLSGVATVRETGGYLKTFQQDNKPQFPLIISKNQALPNGDFEAEVKFQYTFVSFWGTGIALSENPPTNGGGFDNILLTINVWQDKSVGPNMRISFGGQDVFTTPINISSHIFKIERISQKYKVYLDNNLVFTSPDTTSQVKYIWMGNPSIQNPPVPEWTRFNVDYIRVKSLTPTKTPLILIPGIGGSELKVNEMTLWDQDTGHGGKYNRLYGQDEVVWLNEDEAKAPGEDDYFDILRMKNDGVTSEANIGLTNNLVARAYGEAINFFTSNGYQLDKDFFVFPYDWRLNNTLNVNKLSEKIQDIRDKTGSEKVDIITHSMGGLIARAYISDPAKAQNVRKLFTLGTPHLGSPEFLKKLHYGGCLKYPIGPFCLSLAPSELKDVIQNMISGYQLAPSQTYFNFYSDEDSDHPYPYRTENGSLNYLQIKNLLTNLNHNTPLFEPSEIFHTLDHSLSNTNGVDVTIIAGSGVGTLGQIIEKTIATLNGNQINYKDQININGDGTVPLLSASISDPHKGLFLNGPAQVFYTREKHENLVINGSTLNLVKNILEGSNQLPNEVSTQPYKLTGHGLSVHSPVNIHVYDVNVNHTGPLPNGDFEANIPGSSYDTLDDAKFIWLPNSGQYTIKFEATDNGSFDFKIRKFENDVNSETVLYSDIPISSTSQGQTILDTTSTQPPVLQIDQQPVNPSVTLTGNASYDETPSQTTIQLSGVQGLNNWFKSDVIITLNAVDEPNGSGVDKIEYTLDNGQTVQTYINPFTISQEGILKLKFRAIDKAGNGENPKEREIKIDKTPPEALVQFNLTTQNLEINGQEINPGEVIITDEAGNTAKLQVEPKDKKRKEKLEIKSISYNEASPIQLPDNKFEVNFKLDKKTGRLEDLDQTIKIKSEEKLKAKYNPKKDLTRIEIKEQGEKKRIEERNGIILLQLKTNKGQLETNF